MDIRNLKAIEAMRKSIITKYGPTIHGEFVAFMPANRIARIFMSMQKPRKSSDQIKGQTSLFEE